MSTAVLLSVEDHEEFLECARYGDLEDVRALITEGVDVNYRDVSGNAALHKAAGNGHAEIVSVLLAAGAVYQANHAGNTPLHWACLLGHASVAAVLLAEVSGLDIFAKNSAGRSAFTEALGAGHEELARTLLNHSSAEPPENAGVDEEDDDEDDADMNDAAAAGGDTAGDSAAASSDAGGESRAAGGATEMD